MGRKPRTEDDFHFSARFKYDDAVKLREFSRQSGTKYSDIIRIAVSEFLEKYQPGRSGQDKEN